MYKFKYFAHHVEVYDLFGNFIFSADSETEAYSLLRDM